MTLGRILIGSLNVYRFYQPEALPGYSKYKMIGCTSMEVFRVAMDGLENVKGGVTISVVKNFLCKAIHGIENSDQRTVALQKAMEDYLEAIQITAMKKPLLKFALVQPILRPREDWYMAGCETFCKQLDDPIRRMDLRNVSKIGAPIKISQVFEPDGVHLTTTAGKHFIETILYNAEEFFTAEFVDLKNESEEGEKNEETTAKENTNDGSGNLGRRVTMVEREVEKIRDDIKTRRFHDSLLTARMREELDAIGNEKKEDRIIITRRTNKTPAPTNHDEKKVDK
jgi:hypothetical protein